MKCMFLLILAASFVILGGADNRAQAACDVVGTPNALELLDQHLGRGACTCSALNAVCKRQMQGTDPRSANAGQGFCAGSMRQCMAKGVFAYRTYTVTGAVRK